MVELIATRGQAGSYGDPPLCSPENVGMMCETELHRTCVTSGLDPPILLDHPIF